MPHSPRSAGLSAMLMAFSCLAGVERFDEPGPFDWTQTKFSSVISSDHTLARPRIPSGTTCVPPVGAGYPVQCDGDREGQVTGGSATGCEAWAIDSRGPRSERVDTRMTAYVDHTELAGNRQTAGLAARLQTVDAGAGTIQIAGDGAGNAGYVATVTYYPYVASAGYPTVVRLMKVVNTCLEEDGLELCRSNTPFYTQCGDQHFLTFEVVDVPGGTRLTATLDSVTPSGNTPLVIGPGSCVPVESGPTSLVAIDTDPGRPDSGKNAVVGFAAGSESVFFEDVTIHNVTSATFDGFATGMTHGAASGNSPGDTWFDVSPDFNGDGNADATGMISVRSQRFQHPNGSLSYGDMTILPASPNFGLGKVCSVDITDMLFLVGSPAQRVEVDFFASNELGNLRVNGAPLHAGSLCAVPSIIAPGVVCSIWLSETGQCLRGRVRLESAPDAEGMINSFLIGGDSITIDNVHVTSDTPPGYCLIDFNGDGLSPDTADIDDFLTVFSGGVCPNAPFCDSIDFNNDGLYPDTMDIDALLSVFSGGPCLV